MGRPQWNLFKTCQDALDDGFHFYPQMGAGLPEDPTVPLQIRYLVREEVLPRRRGRITLIESCQGLSHSTHRSGSVAVLKKDLLE